MPYTENQKKLIQEKVQYAFQNLKSGPNKEPKMSARKFFERIADYFVKLPPHQRNNIPPEIVNELPKSIKDEFISEDKLSASTVNELIDFLEIDKSTRDRWIKAKPIGIPVWEYALDCWLTAPENYGITKLTAYELHRSELDNSASILLAKFSHHGLVNTDAISDSQLIGKYAATIGQNKMTRLVLEFGDIQDDHVKAITMYQEEIRSGAQREPRSGFVSFLPAGGMIILAKVHKIFTTCVYAAISIADAATGEEQKAQKNNKPDIESFVLAELSYPERNNSPRDETGRFSKEWIENVGISVLEFKKLDTELHLV